MDRENFNLQILNFKRDSSASPQNDGRRGCRNDGGVERRDDRGKKIPAFAGMTKKMQK